MKEWLELLLERFENLPPDRAEFQKANRGIGTATFGGGQTRKGSPIPVRNIKGVGDLYYKRKEQQVPSKCQKMKGELDALLNDWYHYFDTGYKAGCSIDYLPELIKSKIKELLEVV